MDAARAAQRDDAMAPQLREGPADRLDRNSQGVGNIASRHLCRPAGELIGSSFEQKRPKILDRCRMTEGRTQLPRNSIERAGHKLMARARLLASAAATRIAVSASLTACHEILLFAARTSLESRLFPHARTKLGWPD